MSEFSCIFGISLIELLDVMEDEPPVVFQLELLKKSEQSKSSGLPIGDGLVKQ